MTKRQDGYKTRLKLLKAACELFAQKGYQKTTILDICKQADANVAAVNYYFGSKSDLYVETWRYIFNDFEKNILSIQETGSPKKRLKQFIHAVLKNAFVNQEYDYYNRLYILEVVNPTGLLQGFWHEMIDPRRKMLHENIAALIGGEENQELILLCELSILTQIRVFSTTNNKDLEFDFKCPINQDFIDKLADHITAFSIAGIEALTSK